MGIKKRSCGVFYVFVMVFAAFAVFTAGNVYAINVVVNDSGSGQLPALIPELKNLPAVKLVEVTNLGTNDNFEFYNLIGHRMGPVGNVLIVQGETKIVDLLIYPKEEMGVVGGTGNFNLQYFIKGGDGSEVEERALIKVVHFNEAFEIGASSFDPKTNNIEVYIKNKEDFNFGKVKVDFSSPFFKFSKDTVLNSEQTQAFVVELDKADYEKLSAGFYTVNAKVFADGKEADVEGKLQFLERDLIEESQESYGFIVNTNVLTKKNKGNIDIFPTIILKKNIISRLFTTFSPLPDSVRREGVSVYYTWREELKPGEELKVVMKTNWTFPLLLIFFIVVVVALVRYASIRPILIRKKVSFVKTKGGEFAIKVTLTVKANTYSSRINLTDRLPALVKLHERFTGFYSPTRIDEKNKIIEWDLGSLDKGEKRVLSYILYSKLGILGKFSLPPASAVYESRGKVYETTSNRAFLIAEQRFGEEEEY